MKGIIKVILTLVFLASIMLTGCEGEMENKKSFSGTLEDVKRIAYLTGSLAVTDTNKWLVNCTDLGIPFYDGENMNILFGDTFSEFWQKGIWRSNVMAVTKDLDAADGISIDKFIAGRSGIAKELIPSLKADKIEKTCIPTGAVAIGGDYYIYYMSISTWEPRWTVEFGSVHKSHDKGETWTRLENLTWGKSIAPNFAQIFVQPHGEYLYLYGITEARDGACKLARVLSEKIQNFESYEYFVGVENGEPKFIAGSPGLQAILEEKDKSIVIPAPCGEMSVMYNDYLKKFIAVYLGSNPPDIIYRTSDNPWGQWSEAELVATQADYPGLYGGFVHEKYVKDGGKSMYFIMSEWQSYNVSVMEMRFK